MNAIQLWRRIRQADRPVAVLVGTGNLLLCGLLLLMLTGGVLNFEAATTREQETVTQHLVGQIFGYWLAGGLMLFSVLGMTRALFSHLATMLFPPAVLIMSLAFLL